jgi:hypothetical protein
MAKAKPTTWKEIPIGQLMKIAAGPEIQEHVYPFGRVVKKQPIELDGKTYQWAKDIDLGE